MRLGLRLRRLFWLAPNRFGPRVRPGCAGTRRIGSGSAIKCGFQDTVENFANTARAFRKPLAKAIGRAVAIELPLKRPFASLLSRT